jgi:hypothetical protein
MFLQLLAEVHLRVEVSLSKPKVKNERGDDWMQVSWRGRGELGEQALCGRAVMVG